ncbi:hypothetical protein E8E14_014561 [Neopestalotiopsis sp. 37M]|nr:hypothetical protein E8E14_014561 [Neopestalotiopsis sp. 37M]
MKFTTSIIPLLALAGVQALPDSGLEARQAGQLTIEWNSDAGCNGNVIRRDVLPQLPAGDCTVLIEPPTANGFRVIANTATATGCTAFRNAQSLKWGPGLP